MPAELHAEHLALQTAIPPTKVRVIIPDGCLAHAIRRTHHVLVNPLKVVMWSVLKFYTKFSWRMLVHGIYLLLQKYFWKSSDTVSILLIPLLNRMELFLHHLLKQQIPKGKLTQNNLLLWSVLFFPTKSAHRKTPTALGKCILSLTSETCATFHSVSAKYSILKQFSLSLKYLIGLCSICNTLTKIKSNTRQW